MFAGRATFGLRWRRARRRSRDAGSMPIAILITLVGVTLSASLTTMVIGQLRDSRWAADRTAAVAASQAGLDAGLASIRSTAGDLTKLPCPTITGGLTALKGTTTGAPPTYSVSFGYFLLDPSGRVADLATIGDLSNISNPGAATVTGAVRCVNGKLPSMPQYALLRSAGKVGATTRTLFATYSFRTRTTAGTIQLVNFGTAGLCLDAGTHPGMPGGDIVLGVCQPRFSILANQEWTIPTIPNGVFTATGLVFVSPESEKKDFCLKTPTGNDKLKVLPCNSSDKKLEWIVYGASPVPAEAYQITDGSGNCLQAAQPQGSVNPDPTSWTDVVVAACDGSAMQKWNVPPVPLKAIQER